MGSYNFIEGIDVLLARLLSGIGSAARLERVAGWGDATWKLVPVRLTASAVWVEASEDPATVDVSFGRGEMTGVELGYSGKATGAEEIVGRLRAFSDALPRFGVNRRADG